MTLLGQFIDGSRVAVIVQRRLYSGSASDSVIAGDSGHSSCAPEKSTRLGGYGGDERVLWASWGLADAFIWWLWRR